VKPFGEIHVRDIASRSLAGEMNSQGYLLIREVLPPADLNHLLDEIVQIAHQAEWLQPGHPPLERIANASAACGGSDPAYKRISDQIFTLESFHAVTHHPALRQLMTQLVGPRLLIHPKPIPRLIFPNVERFIIRAHQDHHAIAGDPESFTAWMPLHDCPVELGPLQVLEASHHFGLQKTPPGTGSIPRETVRGGDWVGGRINAGDVLLFHSLTVHAASANISNQLRISMDCRFQNYDRAIDPATLVFPGTGGKSWEAIYANWRADDLKYYWKRMPLRLKPSKAELAELAQASDSPEMRSRYARTLEQIESQMLG
jgi:ectoine hydroxylase-related dioxygenase (phytanoyl-CoA dioxygenase family)